jgi:serine/threonine-protein kinase
MSPEQCRGRKVDHRTDIYSFGIVVHLLLTGKRPFVGDSAVDIIVKQVTEAPPAMSESCPELGTQLDAAVLWMLQKDPAKRPATTAAAVDALEAAAGIAGDARPRQLSLGDVAIAPDGAKTPANMKDDELRALVDARTVVTGATAVPGLERTSTPSPSAADLAPRVAPTARPRWLYAAAGALAIVAIATIAVTAQRPPTPAPPSGLVAPARVPEVADVAPTGATPPQVTPVDAPPPVASASAAASATPPVRPAAVAQAASAPRPSATAAAKVAPPSPPTKTPAPPAANRSDLAF